MVLAAVERSEPPGRRLVDDDLAARFLPAPTRWLVTATPPALVRRLMMAAMERDGPGLWANMTCRKRGVRGQGLTISGPSRTRIGAIATRAT